MDGLSVLVADPAVKNGGGLQCLALHGGLFILETGWVFIRGYFDYTSFRFIEFYVMTGEWLT